MSGKPCPAKSLTGGAKSIRPSNHGLTVWRSVDDDVLEMARLQRADMARDDFLRQTRRARRAKHQEPDYRGASGAKAKTGRGTPPRAQPQPQRPCRSRSAPDRAAPSSDGANQRASAHTTRPARRAASRGCAPASRRRRCRSGNAGGAQRPGRLRGVEFAVEFSLHQQDHVATARRRRPAHDNRVRAAA